MSRILDLYCVLRLVPLFLLKSQATMHYDNGESPNNFQVRVVYRRIIKGTDDAVIAEKPANILNIDMFRNLSKWSAFLEHQGLA